MLHAQSIQQQVTLALQTAQPDIPPVVEALQLLGVRNTAISECSGVSPSLVSRWCSGKEPVASSHIPKLLELLHLAYKAAIEEMGRVAAQANPPELERSFRSYRDRVKRAREILAELEER